MGPDASYHVKPKRKYIRDENELAMKQGVLHQLYISECEDNLLATEEANAQMLAQLDAEMEKHNGSEALIKPEVGEAKSL
jgi:structural maintenance of chromosome 4